MGFFPMGFFPKNHQRPNGLFTVQESRVNKVSEEVRIGQEVSVRVLSAEGKLSLSMKPMSFLEKKNMRKVGESHEQCSRGPWLVVCF